MNWKARSRNKLFWLAIIPAVLILINAVLGIFGITLDFENLQEKLIALVEAVFTLLSILGIVVDPTTKGIGDSKRALTYDKPYDDNDVEEVKNIEDLFTEEEENNG